MKKKKTIIMIGTIVLLVLIGSVGSFFYLKDKSETEEKISTYFQNKTSVFSTGDVVSKQQEADILIKTKMNDPSCTFDNPCILLNPYDISPLSALVIYRSNEKASVLVKINDTLVTTMEESTLHAIPIYGLKANFNNTIELEMNNLHKTLNIQTKDLNETNLTIEVPNKNATIDQEIYFLSGTLGTPAAAYDGYGNIVWCLNENYTLDIEFLKNGNILLSNGIASGLSYTYDGFLEIDFLGKIHREYSMKNGYHHELIELKDGTIMIAGSEEDPNAPYNSDFIYRINSDGTILDSVSVYELFKNVDENFANSLHGTNMINNSVQYNEETKEMILSLRGINSIVSLNYETKKINWIFGNPDFYSLAFEPYLLKVTDTSRYPKGQHTAYLTKEGYLTVFNNDFDALDETKSNLIDFQKNYSSAVVYEIKDKNIKTKWEYDGKQKYFNYALGSFIYYGTNSKLIDFGWTYKPSAYVPGVSIYDSFNNTYARILELDELDNEIFNATIEEGIYRAFKHSLYEKTTANYEVKSYILIDNNVSSNLEKVKTKKLFSELDEAIENPYEFDLTATTISLNVIFDTSESVDVILVGKEDDSYVFHYKEKGKNANQKVHLDLNGEYAIYLKVNDIIYNTNKILCF